VTLDDALTLVARHRLGVLVTLRRNGWPQTSNVVYAVRDRQVLVSLTDDRAKTRNLRRDPRATLHVSTGDGAAWAALEATAELSPVSTEPGDATGQALAGLYRAVAGEHPDWDDYYRAMVAERRLLLTLAVTHGYGYGG
jgi:PPOX class probable F420-dependent enzyme